MDRHEAGIGANKARGYELAYDAESDRVILFGGANEVAWGLNDTWAYDYNTNTWTEKSPGPAKHLGARIAYDAESDRIILFGGYNLAGILFNDTWAYDFNLDTWTEMKPSISPPGRNYQAMTYDAKSDRVLTWGGVDAYDKLSPPTYGHMISTRTPGRRCKPARGHILQALITRPWPTMPSPTGRFFSAAFSKMTRPGLTTSTPTPG